MDRFFVIRVRGDELSEDLIRNIFEAGQGIALRAAIQAKLVHVKEVSVDEAVLVVPICNVPTICTDSLK